MTIKSRTTTVYHVVCDRCDNRGPDTTTEAHARPLAYEQGWRWTEGFIGDLAHFRRRDYCPRCVEEMEAEAEANGEAGERGR